MRLFRIPSESRRWLLGWLVPLLAVNGSYTGYLLSRLVSIHSAEISLQAYAIRLIDRSDDAFGEAKSTLAAMKRTELPDCSRAELNRFATILFRSRYLRDMGIMSDHQIDCSTMLGSLNPSLPLPALSFSEPDQTIIYPDIPLFHSSGDPALTLRQGRRYVTFNPNLMASLAIPTYSYVFPANLFVHTSPADHSQHLSQLQVSATSRTSKGRSGRTIFATRCSTKTSLCVTAYALIPVILRSERRHSIESAAAGGLAGVSIALLLVLVIERRQGLEGRFRRAIKHGKLNVVYQPIVEIQTGKTVGAEALARWMDRARGNVSPGDFLPIAARLGLSEALTRFVVRTLLDESKALLLANPQFRISFNITAAELVGAWLLPFLQVETMARGIALRSLAVEVTEEATADHKELAEMIHELRRHEVSVYLDDFGTGYSSLGYLEFLAVDVLKVDKAFTRAIRTESVMSPVLRNIIEMAEELQLNVIVEGVETEEQCAYLKLIANRLLGQGWYFARPMSAADLNERVLTESFADSR